MTGLRRETWNTGWSFREAGRRQTALRFMIFSTVPNVLEGEFSGFGLEGEVSGGKPHLLAHLVFGCGNPMLVR